MSRDIAAIIVRLERMRGSDPEVDREINAACGFPSVGYPMFTASTDAAISLLKRATSSSELVDRPMSIGWSFRIGNLAGGGYFAQIGTSVRDHFGETPAIALCLAVMRSLKNSPTPT